MNTGTEKEYRKVERIRICMGETDLFSRQYQVLRPNTNPGTWERNGRKYSIKGLDNLLRNSPTDKVDYLFGECIKEDLRKYRDIVRERKKKF